LSKNIRHVDMFYIKRSCTFKFFWKSVQAFLRHGTNKQINK